MAGMFALAYEVPSKKIACEEETWSDLSLLIFRENVKGIYSQYARFDKQVSTQAFHNIERSHANPKAYLKKVDVGNDWNNDVDFRRTPA